MPAKQFYQIGGLLCSSLVSSISPALTFGTQMGSTPLLGIVDFELAYGARWRLQDRDPGLISPGNGGDRGNANGNIDDGNLNYEQGRPVSNMLRATGEMTLQWHNVGAFVRGYAFYDVTNMDSDRARTRLGNGALEEVGKDAGILEAYLSLRFSPLDMPLQFRVGQQLVNWGEARFFSSSGVNVANPFNLPRFQQPTGEAADLQMPVGMLWGSLQLNPTIAIEGYYQYEWQPTLIPARGTFLSTTDAYAADGEFVQAGRFSDQGTNVDAVFGLPAGTVGFVPDFWQVPRSADESASDQGQFGLSLRMLLPNYNDTAVSLYFANYHSKAANGYWIYPSTQSYLDYSIQGIVAKRDEFISAGVAPESASAAATGVLLGEFLNGARVGTLYQENIRMLGASFNTTSMSTGTALFGELSYHFNAPMAVVPNQMLSEGIPGSTPERPFPPTNLDQITAEEIAANYAGKTSRFVEKLDRSFLVLGATQLFGPKFGAASSALTAEIGWLHVYGFPDKDELLIQGPGLVLTDTSPNSVFADANAWGYRVSGSLTYNNVLGAFSVRPGFTFGHDVHGVSPPGISPLREGSKSFSLGMNINYLQSLRFDIGYTAFWGAGEYNLLDDRDYLNFSVRYSF